MKTIAKGVDETLTLYLSFKDLMEEFDSISSVSVTTSSDDITATTNTNFAPIVEYDSSDNPVYSSDGKLVQLQLSSGVANTVYSILVSANTKAEFTYGIEFLVMVGLEPQ